MIMGGVGALMPLPRLLFPFFLGIIAWLYPDEKFAFSLGYGILCALFLIFLFYEGCRVETYRSRWIGGGLIFLILFVGGYTLTSSHHQLNRPRHFSAYEGHGGYLRGRIKEPPRERANSYQVVLSVDLFGENGLLENVQGKLMLYLEKDSLAAGLKYGDQLVVPNRFELVSPPQNPSAFHYKQFLSHRQVFHTAYLPSGNWKSTGLFQGNRIVFSALAVRDYAMAVLEQHHLSGQEFAVVSALLLGYRELLDDELQQGFAAAGAMHILCVSGLHVGVIFMVLKMMLSFLPRLPGGRALQIILVILAVWFYAAITGFSPSVLRASVMFTFVGLAQGFRRPTNIYNTLAASAFVLAMAEPGIITRIGFQLSYLAVAGIVALQPIFYRWLTFKWVIADKAWSIVAVSLAAQLATAPLAIYYFNQFPNYFLLTNLIALPLATVIIYLAMLTLLIHPLPWAAGLSGQLLSFLVALLHRSVCWIERLPFSTTEGVFLSFFEAILILAGITYLVRFLCFGRRTACLMAALILAVLVMTWSCRSYQHGVQSHFVVYSVPVGTKIDFFSGRNLVSLVGGSLAEAPDQADFHVSGHRIRRGVRQPPALFPLVQPDTLIRSGSFSRMDDVIVFGGLRMLLVGEQLRGWQHTATKDQPGLADDLGGEAQTLLPFFDYLIVTGGSSLDEAAFLSGLSVNRLIIDRSCPPWEAGRWEAACGDAGIPVWNIRKKGAYVYGINLHQPGKDQGNQQGHQYRQHHAVK